TGMVATMLLIPRHHARREPVAPRAALREAEQRAAATRANLLIMLGALVHLVRESKLALDGCKIAHHHRGRVRLPTASAALGFASRAGVLIETDANLRRPLENVEQ